MSETPVLVPDVTSFDWAVAYGSSVRADPIHHIFVGDSMLCSGGRAIPTHHGTATAPNPCKRCLRQWRRQVGA